MRHEGAQKRKYSKCRGFMIRMCLAFFRNSKEPSVAGVGAGKRMSARGLGDNHKASVFAVS